MSLAVSIVSYNTKTLLYNCLKNLSKQTHKEKINIWVLDNASSDGSAEMVEEEFPRVKLIKSEKNLGFAAGHNQILRQIDDEYALLLNPDTEFEESFIKKMATFMEENPECVISGCKLVDFNNKLEANGGNFPFGASLINWLFNLEFIGNLSNFHRFEKDYYSSVHEVDWIAGTMMVLRMQEISKLNFFNEEFFMYFEDVDLCYRAKKAGGKIMINPEVEIKHKSGSSSKDPRFTQWKGEFAGLIKFYNMNVGFLGALYVRLLIYIAILARMIAFLVSGNPKKTLTYGRILVSI